MRFHKPCLDCGKLSVNSRCDEHSAAAETRRASGRVRPHYSGTYRARAKKVREQAVSCWICKEGARVGDPWQADHYLPGDLDSPLLPAHRSCNIRRHHELKREQKVGR